MSRSWDAITTDVESIAVEMRAKVDGEQPPEPPPDGDVIVVEGDDLAAAVASAPAGSTLDLDGRTFVVASLLIDKSLTLRYGEVHARPNANEIINLRGDANTLHDVIIRGDGTTKRGITNNATGTVLRNVQIRNICREGQETQALAMWDSVGPLLAEDCYFEGGSIGFLAGGSEPTVPNTIPTGLTFRRCQFLRPLEWRSKNYACKNAFELKCARDVLVEDCELGNVWKQGQTGFLVQLTPSQYGNSPNTTVENVEFRRCNFHDGASGFNALGYSQHQNDDRPTQRGGNYRIVECTFTNILKSYGGNGTVLQLAWSPLGVEWIDNNVQQDGDAFLRVADEMPVDGFTFRGGRVDVAGTYGIFAPQGSRGANWQQIAPGGVIEGVTFVNAHSTFKGNFPMNTYETEAVTLSLNLSDELRDRLEDLAIGANVTLAELIRRELAA